MAVDSVVGAGFGVSLSRWVGLRGPIDTVSLRPCLSVRVSTEYGPSYGGCNGLRTVSRRMKTGVVVARALLTILTLLAGRGGRGRVFACEPGVVRRNLRG